MPYCITMRDTGVSLAVSSSEGLSTNDNVARHASLHREFSETTSATHSWGSQKYHSTATVTNRKRAPDLQPMIWSVYACCQVRDGCKRHSKHNRPPLRGVIENKHSNG